MGTPRRNCRKYRRQQRSRLRRLPLQLLSKHLLLQLLVHQAHPRRVGHLLLAATQPKRTAKRRTIRRKVTRKRRKKTTSRKRKRSELERPSSGWISLLMTTRETILVYCINFASIKEKDMLY